MNVFRNLCDDLTNPDQSCGCLMELSIPDDAASALDRMSDALGLGGRVELIKVALSRLDSDLEHCTLGGVIAYYDADGNEGSVIDLEDLRQGGGVPQ